MEITRETDYAIRCVLYLSRKRGTVTMVDEISREMCIPKSFLAKILQKLTKSSLVKSYRGVKGGFEVARSPREISLLDVIECIQGPVGMNKCAVDKKACGLSGSCSVHPIWVEARKQVERFLRSKNFAQLNPRLRSAAGSSPGDKKGVPKAIKRM